MKVKRNLVLIVFAAVLLIGAASCSRRERLYIYNWSYYTPDDVIELFQEEFGVRVIYDEYASNEEMYAKILATNREGLLGRFLGVFSRRYDIVFPSEDYTAIMISQELLEPINRALVPNLRNIDPLVLRKAEYDSNMNYSVPYFWGAAGIAVNTARVRNFEHTWSIFGRSDVAGGGAPRMTMLDDMRETMGAALGYLGYSANTRNQREIEAARDLINNQWKPNLATFDGVAYAMGYARGDFWVVNGYAEDIFWEIYEDEQLMRDTVFFIPPNGTAFIDSMVILKGSRNIELAHEFINFIHRPDIYALFVDEFGLPATVNIPARQHKEGDSWYELEDILDLELKFDLGPALEHFNNAWFNSIRVGN
ncbi:MAG: extracellular solute-binding protein [Treponema sp.]|nr:extracellular solute-binding protein [Treponema sp.]